MPFCIEAATFTIDPSGTIQRKICAEKRHRFKNQPIVIANRVEMEAGVSFVPVKNQDTIVFYSSSQGLVVFLH